MTGMAVAAPPAIPPAIPPAGDAPTGHVAIVRTGALRLALPFDVLVNAIPYPQHVCATGNDDAVIGIGRHSGAPLPLVDCDALFGAASALPPEDRAVLVVEVGGRRTGLVVDRIETLSALPGDIWKPLSQGDERRSINAVAAGCLPGIDDPVLLLDGAALTNDPRVVFADSPAPQDGAPPRAGGQGRLFLIFAWNGRSYGIGVDRVSEIVKRPAIKAHTVPHAALMGRFRHRDDTVLMIADPCGAVEGAPGGADPAYGLIVTVGTRRFALPAGEITTMRRVPDAGLIALPPPRGAAVPTVRHLVRDDAEDRTHRVIDPVQVAETPGLKEILEGNAALETARPTDRLDGDPVSLMQLDFGSTAYAPTADFVELGRVRADAIIVTDPHARNGRCVVHRGESAAFVDVAPLIGAGPTAPADEYQVVYLRTDGHLTAIPVRGIRSIEHFWLDYHDETAPKVVGMAISQRDHLRLASARNRLGKRTIAIVDFPGLLREPEAV